MIAAVVLAAGAATRFGSPKQRLLVEEVLERVRAAGIRELGFPVWARSITPRVGTNRRVGQTQVPVACGDIVVHPGDWIFADDDGVVVVPAANVEKVLAAAETTDAKERKIAERIKAGESTIDILNFRDLVYPKSQ